MPITMVVLGDSISTGLNASITSGVAPKQEGYVGLVAQGLEERFGSKITVKNLSISGKSSPWGLEQVPTVIAESPDLFLCAFGMNDASSRRPTSEFTETIRQIVEKVRAARPDCDTILITSMSANPEWSLAAPELYPEYAAGLEKLATRGVAVANVTTIWTALLQRKGVLDLSGNGLNHPNDFGHRVYADVILETIGR
ncbi:MAG: SGNH/GDSL hydrolase family protein [Verrucomicrobia bacterium]|nr:SGNH/GDSL hydrolase family protein [Verrucomicrobiota bacterium]